MSDSHTAETLYDILTSVKTIALVGASANEARPSHQVMQFLMAKGYTLYPINPGLAGQTLLGRTVYATLHDVQQPIDMVDIFRQSDAVPAIVDEALSLPHVPRVIWMQLGVQHDQAAARARAAGLQVVVNRCPKIELAKLGL